MTPRTHDNFRPNFWTWVDPPPIWTMFKKTSLFPRDGFPKRKWRENEKMKREWGNGQRMRKWKELTAWNQEMLAHLKSFLTDWHLELFGRNQLKTTPCIKAFWPLHQDYRRSLNTFRGLILKEMKTTWHYLGLGTTWTKLITTKNNLETNCDNLRNILGRFCGNFEIILGQL